MENRYIVSIFSDLNMSIICNVKNISTDLRDLVAKTHFLTVNNSQQQESTINFE